MIARQLSSACLLGSRLPLCTRLCEASRAHIPYHSCVSTFSPHHRCLATAAAELPERPSPKRPPRFYVSSNLLKSSTAGTTFQLDTEETHHALRVLRMREGDALEVCDGLGGIAAAELRGITASNKAYVETTAEATQVEWRGPKWEVVAACFSLKGGRADWLVEKCTELGAWGLRPILTVRSPYLGRKQVVIEVAPLDADSEEELDDVETPQHAKQKRWARVQQAAVKQCLRAHSLQLRNPLHVAQLAGQVAKASAAFVGMEGAPPIGQVLAEQRAALDSAAQPDAQPCMLLVGPEGDFTPMELDDLMAAGARPVGLGPNRLRVETAALAMLTAVTLWQADS